VTNVVSLAKRIAELEMKRAPARRTVGLVIESGEDIDLAIAEWKAANPGEKANFFGVRVILGGQPNPDRCTAESVAKAAPEMKRILAGWREHGGGDRVAATAAHWQMLCERFQIAE
jgi:hypothetical protein